jgi:hypothetical protein
MQRKRASKGMVESSRSCNDHRGWLALWDAQVPNKFKVHMSRLIENGLVVGTELSHRNIKDGVVCLACGRTESLVHHFWSCPHSAETWNFLASLVGFRLETPPMLLRCHSDLKGWLLDWIGRSSGNKVELMLTLVYNLWQAQNDARESLKLADPRAIVQKSIAALEEWHNVHTTPSKTAIKVSE